MQAKWKHALHFHRAISWKSIQALCQRNRPPYWNWRDYSDERSARILGPRTARLSFWTVGFRHNRVATAQVQRKKDFAATQFFTITSLRWRLIPNPSDVCVELEGRYHACFPFLFRLILKNKNSSNCFIHCGNIVNDWRCNWIQQFSNRRLWQRGESTRLVKKILWSTFTVKPNENRRWNTRWKMKITRNDNNSKWCYSLSNIHERILENVTQR